MEKLEPSYIASQNVKWDSRSGKEFGGYSEVKTRLTMWNSNSFFFLIYFQWKDNCFIVLWNSNCQCSVHFSHSVVSDSLRLHGLQHARPPCPSPTPRAYLNSCPSSQWCYPAISSSVIPFSSHLQSFPASGSSPMNQFFTSGGQSFGVSASASVRPMNIQDWFPL